MITNSIKNYLLAFTCLLLTTLSVFGQARENIHEQLRFQSLTVDDGLTHNRVRGLAQDHLGFIWIGTNAGINRYDGLEITRYEEFYVNDTSVKSFSNEDTKVIFCDSRENLWVGGNYGVCKYNRAKDRFEKLAYNGDASRIKSTEDIAEDSDSALWITMTDELVRYHPGTNELKSYPHDPSNARSLPGSRPTKLAIDSKDNVWVGFRDEGLAYLDRRAGNFQHFEKSEKDENTISEQTVERLYIDDKGILWIGHSNTGLTKFNPGTRKFTRYMPEPDVKESGRVKGIYKDPKGNFWIGTMAGIYLFDEREETFFHYAYSDHPISRLSHNSIQTMMMDGQQGLWFGTFAGGVSFTNLNTSGFVKYEFSHIPSPYYLNDKAVYSLTLDKKGNIWVGTENGGLNYLNRETGKFTAYPHDPDNPNSPQSNNIKSIAVDKKNNIWFASYKGGVSYFDVKTDKFTHYLPDEDDPYSIHHKNAYTLTFDPANPDVLWVGTEGGLSRMDIKTKRFTHITQETEGYQNTPALMNTNDVSSATAFGDNHIAVGIGGLVLLNTETNTFNKIDQVKGVDVTGVNFMQEDHLGNLWFDINYEYLGMFNPTDSSYRLVPLKEHLPSVKPLEALDDEQGNIWLSSTKGIIKLENVIYNEDSLVIKRYDASDNLQGMQFLYRSKAKSPSGELFFGGTNGFNSFYPQNIQPNPYPPKVHITNLKVNNKDVEVGEKVYGRVLLDKPLLETDEITVHNRIKAFTIEFNALHYVAPESNQIAYKLEGYEDDWNYRNASINFATYTNLPAGDYTFKVKAANNSGVWTEGHTSLNIVSVPPFWKTWWFYTLVVVFIAVTIVGSTRYQKARAKKAQKELEAEINARTSELEQQNAEIQKHSEKEKLQSWISQELAQFSNIISKNKGSLEEMADEILSNLVHDVKAHQSTMTLLNEDNEQDPYLEIIATYAVNRDRLENNRLEIGEGLVGACFKDGEKIYLDNLPESYISIESGLGGSKQGILLLLPLKTEEKVLGVLELAFFDEVPGYMMDFMERLSEVIALNLNAANLSRKTTELLEQTQSQTEEMRAQEEEMRQNMEEMQATQEEFHRREEEYKQQLEELEQKVSKLENEKKSQKQKSSKSKASSKQS